MCNSYSNARCSRNNIPPVTLAIILRHFTRCSSLGFECMRQEEPHKHKILAQREHETNRTRNPPPRPSTQPRSGKSGKCHFFRRGCPPKWPVRDAQKLFQHKRFGPHPRPPLRPPPQQKKLMCLISWERTQKVIHITFSRGISGVQMSRDPGRGFPRYQLRFLCEEICYCKGILTRIYYCENPPFRKPPIGFSRPIWIPEISQKKVMWVT